MCLDHLNVWMELSQLISFEVGPCPDRYSVVGRMPLIITERLSLQKGV